MSLLVSHQVTFEGEFQPTNAPDLRATKLIMVTEIHLDEELLIAFRAPEFLLSLCVLAPEVPPELVKPHEPPKAQRTLRRGLLVVPALAWRLGDAEMAARAAVRLAVHFHRLRIFEGLAAPGVSTPEWPPVLNQIDRNHIVVE